EQRHLQEARASYRHHSDVLIPQLLPFCSSDVTAMERVYGTKITDVRLPPWQAQALAARLLDRVITVPFWQPEGDALFHADPHAGNLWHTPDGRVALLDWSLAARLPKAARETVVQIVLGAITLNAERIADGIADLASSVTNRSTLRQATRKATD